MFLKKRFLEYWKASVQIWAWLLWQNSFWQKITFFAYLTKKSWRLEKVHVNFILLVGCYWLFKLVRSSTLKKTVYLSRFSFSSGNLISSSNHDYVRSRRMRIKYAKKPTIFRKMFDINLGSWVKSVVFLPYMSTFT